MKARKCDRCGKFYDDYKPTEKTKNANAIKLMGATQTSAHNSGWYDLCEGCMKDLVTLLDTSPEAQEEPVEPPVKGGDTDPSLAPNDPENPSDKLTEGEGEGTA